VIVRLLFDGTYNDSDHKSGEYPTVRIPEKFQKHRHLKYKYMLLSAPSVMQDAEFHRFEKTCKAKKNGLDGFEGGDAVSAARIADNDTKTAPNSSFPEPLRVNRSPSAKLSHFRSVDPTIKPPRRSRFECAQLPVVRRTNINELSLSRHGNRFSVDIRRPSEYKHVKKVGLRSISGRINDGMRSVGRKFSCDRA
jgi:hypothetical protein